MYKCSYTLPHQIYILYKSCFVILISHRKNSFAWFYHPTYCLIFSLFLNWWFFNWWLKKTDDVDHHVIAIRIGRLPAAFINSWITVAVLPFAGRAFSCCCIPACNEVYQLPQPNLWALDDSFCDCYLDWSYCS